MRLHKRKCRTDARSESPDELCGIWFDAVFQGWALGKMAAGKIDLRPTCRRFGYNSESSAATLAFSGTIAQSG
jgi:hypothetical protein